MKTNCPECQTYLNRRRTRLLPFLGRWVQRNGKPPTKILAQLLLTNHQKHAGRA